VILDFSATAVRDLRIEPVCAMELDTETQSPVLCRPSVTVLPAGQREGVWQLAKRYCSTPELILSANGINDGESIEGKLLLIPRAR